MKTEKQIRQDRDTALAERKKLTDRHSGLAAAHNQMVQQYRQGEQARVKELLKLDGEIKALDRILGEEKKVGIRK